jgi:hypothetical protein
MQEYLRPDDFELSIEQADKWFSNLIRKPDDFE